MKDPESTLEALGGQYGLSGPPTSTFLDENQRNPCVRAEPCDASGENSFACDFWHCSRVGGFQRKAVHLDTVQSFSLVAPPTQ